MRNRSAPEATVFPVLAYDSVAGAVEFLCAAFGFAERLRIGDHRSQLTYGDGVVVVQALPPAPARVQVRVDDADAHCARAAAAGAVIVTPPADHAYGERQYVARDIAGHLWTFSQSIADVDPVEWGGEWR